MKAEDLAKLLLKHHDKEVYELKSLNSRTHLGIELDSHEIYLQENDCGPKMIEKFRISH